MFTTGAEKIFYTLSIVAAAAAIFVLQPTSSQSVAAFQSEVKHQFKVATIQTFGDQPVFDDTLTVIQSVNTFYQKSADELIVLLTPTPAEDDLNKLAINVASEFKLALTGLNKSSTYTEPAQTAVASSNTTVIPGNFMSEEPIHNIVPDALLLVPKVAAQPVQASAEPQVWSGDTTWTTLQDGVTGQVYCVGVFNAEVNQYLGPCKHDYY